MPANRAPGRDRPHVRLKLKFPAYVVTHRMLTGLTATRVWEIVAVTDALRRGLCRRQAATRLRPHGTGDTPQWPSGDPPR